MSEVLYEKFSGDGITRPTASFDKFQAASIKAIEDFLVGNKVIDVIKAGEFSMKHYHSLLCQIFHQVYFSSTSFAMAGAMISTLSVNARNYLLHHAEEEKDHWIWILEDLKSTGYTGPDPRSVHASWASQAYLSYGVFLSVFNPLGRLAMANVLEGISGKFGLSYGQKGLISLKIKKEQAKFFLVHGELDQGHTLDIIDILKNENLSELQWGELVSVAENTSKLYKQIYNLSIESSAG